MGTDASSNDAEDNIVARVNSEVITKDELYDYLVNENGRTALNYLIANKIVELEAKSQDIKVTDEDLQKEIDVMADQYGGQETFEQYLKMYGYSLDNIKSNIETNLNIMKLLEHEITVEEDEMKAYFETNKERFDEKEQVRPVTSCLIVRIRLKKLGTSYKQVKILPRWLRNTLLIRVIMNRVGIWDIS